MLLETAQGICSSPVAKFSELLGLGEGSWEASHSFSGTGHPARLWDTPGSSKAAGSSSHRKQEDPERDGDLAKVTQHSRGNAGIRTQGSRFPAYRFPGSFQPQKQHVLQRALLAKLLGVGFAVSTVDFLALKFSSWESQL